MPNGYSRAEKVAAVQRCAAEVGKVPLCFGDYKAWHASAPDRRSLPSGVAIGRGADFVALCDEAGVASSFNGPAVSALSLIHI